MRGEASDAEPSPTTERPHCPWLCVYVGGGAVRLIPIYMYCQGLPCTRRAQPTNPTQFNYDNYTTKRTTMHGAMCALH